MTRSDDYMNKIVFDALDKEVIFDAKVRIQYEGSKLKAYCPDTKTFLQFPKNLRSYGESFVADVVKSGRTEGRVFYRAYKKSIRKSINGDIIA